jgi:hypothetical protein
MKLSSCSSATSRWSRERGIYTELTDTGAQLLSRARPDHDATLRDALTEAQGRPELSPLVGLIASPQASPAEDGQG